VRVSNSKPLAGRMPTILQRPLLGPLLFGLIFGGLPIGAFLWFRFDYLARSASSSSSPFVFFTVIGVLVATLSALTGANRPGKNLFYRSFLATLAAFLPIPIAVWAIRLANESAEVWFPANLPFMIMLLTFWALTTPVLGCIIAEVYVYLRNQRSRQGG
jgi:hypothetical protein